MQVSTIPQFLAPIPGATLLCLRLSGPQAVRQIRLTLGLMVHALPGNIAYGVETWRDTPLDHLFVIWTLPGDVASRAILLKALRSYGEPIEWWGHLRITGRWEPFYGEPRIVGHEALSEVAAPEWLARLQLQVPALAVGPGSAE